MKVLLRPVSDRRGGVLLYDIFVDGAWHGSRRTMDQCRSYARWVRDDRSR